MSKQVPDNILQATFLMSGIMRRIERKRMDAKPEEASDEKRELKQPEEEKSQEGDGNREKQ